MNVLNKLTLSPFEWSMANQVSASPMEFVVRLDCVGVVDAAKFTEAISIEINRQPLLQANAFVGDTHRESYWRLASNCVPEIRWCEGNPDGGSGYPEGFVPIDLGNEIGFRFYCWHFHVSDQPRVVMKFVYHHACCDGKGGMGFAENVLHRYQSLMEGNSVSLGELATVDAQQIFSRNLPCANKLRAIDRIWRALVVRPKRVGNMLLSKPRTFSEHTVILDRGDKEIFANPSQRCTARLSVDETRQLGVLARKLSASSNTVLARELFHAVSDCLKSDSRLINSDGTKPLGPAAGHKNRDLRILIPFSLRDKRHAQMPAANCVSMAYLETKERVLEADSSSNPVLVSALAGQVSFIRRWNLQYSWIESLDLYATIWPIVRFLKLRKKGRSGSMSPIVTAVMTNLGRVFSGSHLANSEGEVAVKSMVVKSVHLAAPCNATMIVNFSINFYGNRLTLDVNYLPSLLKEETAQALLTSWKRRILDSIAGVPIDG